MNLKKFIMQFITCKTKNCEGCKADVEAIISAVRSEFAKEILILLKKEGMMALVTNLEATQYLTRFNKLFELLKNKLEEEVENEFIFSPNTTRSR